MLRRNNLRLSCAYIGLEGTGPLFTKSFGFGPALSDDAHILKYSWIRIHFTFLPTYYKPKKLRDIKDLSITLILMPRHFNRGKKYTRNGRQDNRHNPHFTRSNRTRKIRNVLIRETKKWLLWRKTND